MGKLNKTQQMILDALVVKRKMTVEEVADLYYKDRERPTYWRNSTIVIIRSLIFAIGKSSSYYIARTSPLGRGETAEYTLFSRGER
jgi:hypothetical protein